MWKFSNRQRLLWTSRQTGTLIVIKLFLCELRLFYNFFGPLRLLIRLIRKPLKRLPIISLWLPCLRIFREGNIPVNVRCFIDLKLTIELLFFFFHTILKSCLKMIIEMIYYSWLWHLLSQIPLLLHRWMLTIDIPIQRLIFNPMRGRFILWLVFSVYTCITT